MTASSAPGRGLRLRVRHTMRLGRALRLVWEGAPGWALANLGIVVLLGLVPLLLLYIVKLIVDDVAAATTTAGGVEFSRIGYLIALAALVSLLGTGLRIAGNFVGEVQGRLVTDHVLGILYAKAVSVDLAHHEDPAYQDRLHRTQREAPYRPAAVLHTLTGIVQGAAMAVGVVVLLAAVHWLLALALFLAVLPGTWVRLRFTNQNYAWLQRRAHSERQSNYTGALLADQAHAKELRVLGLGPLLLDRFREIRTRLRTEQLSLVRSRSIGEIATHGAATIVVFGSLAYFAHLTLVGVLSIGSLVMYFQAVQRGQSAMQDVLGGAASLYEHNLFLSNLDEFLALESRVVSPAEPVPVPSMTTRGLLVDDVSFTYPFANRPALRGVSLEVNPGEMVAIVGANGSGKTTLIKLLCRLYDPDEGGITCDATDLRRFDPEEWRRNIAVVFQDFARYSMPVSDNIWFGDVHRPKQPSGMADAARAAGLERTVRRFQDGYDTMLGRSFQGGVELSGGEWQKVALARAFYSGAQLLVLDEPSSSLDAHAEAELFSQIRRHTENRAVVVVSHRFSTVRMADRIYVLDEGRVKEAGTHDELMLLQGTYAHLFEVQAAMYRHAEPKEVHAVA
jgi:ATP-binding cassette, subfamily B, bacterial